MRPTRLAFFGMSLSTLTLSSCVFDSLPVNSGTSWGANVTISGGTAPYVYGIYWGTTLQYQQTSSSTSLRITGPAMESWNGQQITIRVTDANGAGSTVISSPITMSVYWIHNATVTPAFYSAPVGASITCYSGVSANPGVSGYQWWYQYKPVGGSWTGRNNWPSGGNGSTAVAGPFVTAGDQYRIYCDMTNSVGMITGSSSTLTVT